MKLLLVDKDRHWVEMLTGWLKTIGYEVHYAYTAERARVEWLERQPNLVLLDPVMKVDMLALCQELRKEHDAFLLILTEGKDVYDEVHCLESGADDYLRKPIMPAQLLAHMHAVSRRARSTIECKPSSIVTVGPLRVDSAHNEVTINGEAVRLTRTESKLLYLLAMNANGVCTVDQIITYVWGYDSDSASYLVKTHIYHLRQKIEPEPGNPHYIITIPGLGYKLVHHSLQEQTVKEVSRTLRVVSMGSR